MFLYRVTQKNSFTVLSMRDCCSINAFSFVVTIFKCINFCVYYLVCINITEQQRYYEHHCTKELEYHDFLLTEITAGEITTVLCVN